MFGNYRGFSINPISGVIQKSPILQKTLYEELGVIDQKNAIQARDEKIAAWLNWQKADFLLDVGCDFGSLLNECNKLGIESIGYDIDPSAIQLLISANLNHRSVSIEDIVNAGELLLPTTFQNKQLRAVSCLNILHSGNLSSSTRERFIKICLDDADFVVVTLTKSMLKRLQRKVSFQVLGFIGGTQNPISDFNSQLRQYGSTFKFRGRLGRVEKFFWGLIYGRYDYPKPSNSYEKLVVILAKGRND